MPYQSRLPEIAADIMLNVTHAVGEGARRIADDAKTRVPVRTGQLRDAIHIRQQGQEATIIAGDKEVFYGHIVEHGGVHTPAHPFLIPALEANREDVIALVQARMRGL